MNHVVLEIAGQSSISGVFGIAAETTSSAAVSWAWYFPGAWYRQVIERVAEIAEKRGVPRVHIALAWLLQKKLVTAPIVGATKITHLEDAVGALSIKLIQEEVAYVEEPYVPHRIVGHQ